MEKQVEDVYRPCKGSIFEHDKFFQNMGHRSEWSEQHEHGECYQNRVGDIIDEGKHVSSFHISPGTGWISQLN